MKYEVFPLRDQLKNAGLEESVSGQLLPSIIKDLDSRLYTMVFSK